MPNSRRSANAGERGTKRVPRPWRLAIAAMMISGGFAQAQEAAPAPAPVPLEAAAPGADTASSPVATAEPAPAEPMPPAASPANPASTAQAGTATLPHDLSPWGMFMAADYVVKGVMTGLALASVATWLIWVAKVLELVSVKGRAKRALRRLEGAGSLSAVEGDPKWKARGPVAALVRSAVQERERSTGLSADGIKERAQIALHRIEARAGRVMARGTGILATIGSTAPFVGLFGTVWGIMNSFIGISRSNTTNLAVVAPGIAEALLATAIGLVAAIPAVIIYNTFSRSIAGYRSVLADASAEVLRHLSRDLDRERSVASRPQRPQRLEAAE